jgi:hypothetical protein
VAAAGKTASHLLWGRIYYYVAQQRYAFRIFYVNGYLDGVVFDQHILVDAI